VAITLTLCALVSVVYFCPSLAQALQFDRDSVASGELWRVVTCHLPHFSFDHLCWDTLVLLILGVVCERRSRGCYLICLAVSAIAISLGVWLAVPQLGIYRGLSGVDTALFSMLAVSLLREKWSQRDWLWMGILGVLAAGLAGKLAYEILAGGSVFVAAAAADFQPVPLAHLVGVAVGAVIGGADIRYHLCSRTSRRETALSSARDGTGPSGGLKKNSWTGLQTGSSPDGCRHSDYDAGELHE
jgi:rhomboid family GlyGly-CTERM serine protease